MDTIEILNKSLAWLSKKDKKGEGFRWNFIDQFSSTRTYSSGWLIGFESDGKDEWRFYFGNEMMYATIPIPYANGGNHGAPQELFILTHLILHTLNTEPERFHRLVELPGFENQDWNQLEHLTCYLLKQGWIEVKPMQHEFLIKLSMQGRTFVGNHNHDAWA